MRQFHLPDFESSEARTQHFRDNAEYYTVTYRENYENLKGAFATLPEAREAAQKKANEKKKPILIYGVIGPYDSWVENVQPQKNWGDHWADEYIEQLKRGESIQCRPHGSSMYPLIKSGQLITVSPNLDSLNKDDIVLVTIGKRQYVHRIIKIDKNLGYQIGNNRGGINGWVEKEAIHGKVVKIED